MGKKGQVINHYHIEELEVKTKIDYKELAKEIVTAQQEAKKANKRPNRFRAAVMATANTMAPALLVLFSVLACIGMWIEFSTKPVHSILEYIAYTVMFIGIIVVSVCCGVEAWRDDDENAIMHFNTNVALVALIVAFVALVRGVG